MSLGQKERFSLVIVGLGKGGVINAAGTKGNPFRNQMRDFQAIFGVNGNLNDYKNISKLFVISQAGGLWRLNYGNSNRGRFHYM